MHNGFNTHNKPNYSENPNDFPELNNRSGINFSNAHQYTNNKQSYSEALRNSNENNNNSMDRIEAMLANLLNMITMLISKLCK